MNSISSEIIIVLDYFVQYAQIIARKVRPDGKNIVGAHRQRFARTAANI